MIASTLLAVNCPASAHQDPVKVQEVPRRGTRSLAVGETYGQGPVRYSTPQGSNILSPRFQRVSPVANDLRPLRGRFTAATLTEPASAHGAPHEIDFSKSATVSLGGDHSSTCTDERVCNVTGILIIWGFRCPSLHHVSSRLRMSGWSFSSAGMQR